jgi:hypothetical protein
MKAGACERSECVQVSQKSVRIFFDTKFHDDTQASEPRHETITISQHHERGVTTHCNRVMIIKKKFADGDV